MPRIISVWLPTLATDRLARLHPEWRERAVATATSGGTRRLMAVNRESRQSGLKPHITVSDALALRPDLIVAPEDSTGDRRLLEALAERCGMFSPWTAAEESFLDSPEDRFHVLPGTGLWLDIAGCEHLFGGEAKLLQSLTEVLHRLGFAYRAALADTAGAAWGWARYARAQAPILAPGAQQQALANLPVAALRLSPDIVRSLTGLGLRRIGNLLEIPRAALAPRFGKRVARRLDQALGLEPEPITPLRPPAPHRVHMALPEPIGRTEDVEEAARRLLRHLCRRLEKEALGLLSLAFLLFRVDGSMFEIKLGTSAPSRDERHLFRMISERLNGLDAGFGIEALRMEARETAPLLPHQREMETSDVNNEALEQLLDTLGNRLGFDNVVRLAPFESHVPERAQRAVSAMTIPKRDDWQEVRRPVLLLDHPERVEVTAPLPDSPPLQFRWRDRLHRVARAEGPERISCEWWQDQKPDRDYYRVEDSDGKRFWLYREGLHMLAHTPEWFLHGVFP